MDADEDADRHTGTASAMLLLLTLIIHNRRMILTMLVSCLTVVHKMDVALAVVLTGQLVVTVDS